MKELVMLVTILEKMLFLVADFLSPSVRVRLERILVLCLGFLKAGLIVSKVFS